MTNEGRLIYVVGPSGAGKDSVIASARDKLADYNSLYFSHRYVTRPVSTGVDDWAITATAFAHYKCIGMFALDWEAHGLRYGISVVIDNQLAAGRTVVVNGSRAHLAQARAKYPRMTAVHITVDPDVACARLYARGREDAAAIRARLERTPDIALPPQQVVTIDNSGPLEFAALALLRLLVGDRVGSRRAARNDVAAF